MTPGSLVDYTLASLSWAALVSRLPGLRAAGQPVAARWLWLNLLGLSLAITLRLPALYGLVGRVAAVPNLAWVVASVAVLTASWAMLACLAHLRQPAAAGPHIRASGLRLGVAASLMVGLFAAAPRQPATPAFPLGHDHPPLLAACVLVYVAALGGAMAAIIRSFWTYARRVDRGILRGGLRLTVVGGALGLVALISQAVVVVADPFGMAAVLGPLGAVVRMLCVGGIGLTLLGITIPVWAAGAGSWFREYRDHRRLYTLWHTIVGSTTQGRDRSLAARVRDMCTVRNLHYRVYRRIRESRTAMLGLHVRVDAPTVAAAHLDGQAKGLLSLELAAYTEARILNLALGSRNEPSGDMAGPPTAGSGGSDLRSEAWFLTRVAAYFAAATPRRHHRVPPGVETSLS